MESTITIKATKKELIKFFNKNDVCTVRHFNMNDTETFLVIIRHKELPKRLCGTYTIPELIEKINSFIDEYSESMKSCIMVLCMVALEDGITKNKISKMLWLLSSYKEYMPIEFQTDNTAAIGFIESEYYESHDYKPDFIENTVNAILDDINLESPDKIYPAPDEKTFYMDYFND